MFCDNCGGEIPQLSHRHTWAGPVPAEGGPPLHYHLSRDFPSCRLAAGIHPMPGVVPVGGIACDVEMQVALELARRFTLGDPEGKPVHSRLEHGMLNAAEGPDGYPTLAPVTPLEVGRVIAAFLAEAGLVERFGPETHS